MAKLIYSAITSLDGYLADKDGNFDWAAPSEEVHAFVNQLERSVGTYLYGRGMYETMVYWQTAHTRPESSPVELDYAEIWQAADKIMYSRTMTDVSSARTRIEREFDPDAVRGSRRAPGGTSVSVGLNSRPRPSRTGSSRNITCSSIPWSWAAARPPCPTTSDWTSNCSRNTASPAVSSISTTDKPTRTRPRAECRQHGASADASRYGREYHHDDSDRLP